MDVKEVVRVAKNYVTELFGDEDITHVGLEEVDFDQSDTWVVTIGFSRPWDRNIGSVLGGRISRSYKVVRIRDEDGKVLSVNERALRDSG